jgi:NADH dehydrogenase/NADH:ubiquinone oxidoreductase subunit G
MLLFTGALTSKPYAFTARPWELRSVQSIDVLDGTGSNIRIDFKETEILRVLPRRNMEINESWISDKIRFFYDGLKRQRLNSPYVKIQGELKKVKWSKVLHKLISVLKVYSFEYGSSKIGLLLGNRSDSESFFVARDLCLNFGFSNLGLDQKFNVTADNTANYSFNGEFKDLEKVDFCLLVGTNPRFEASVLNLRLRKIFRRGDLKVASIGESFSTIFPVEFSGLTSRTLMDFVEGRHTLCKVFAKAKNPVVLFGSNLMLRDDVKGIKSLFEKLNSNFSTLFQKNLSISPIQTSANIVGGLELGYESFKTEKLRGLKVFFGIGIENTRVLQHIKNNEFPVVVLQDSHGNTTTTHADFILPSTTFVEKNSTYYNMEGRPQKTQRALVGPNLARDDWRIFRILFSYLKKTTCYSTQAQLIAEGSKILPSLYFANLWFSKREKAPISLLRTDMKEKLYVSYLKLPIADFYMTSAYCQSSRVMAKASQYLRSYFHNYKFLTYIA